MGLYMVLIYEMFLFLSFKIPTSKVLIEWHGNFFGEFFFLPHPFKFLLSGFTDENHVT